jgi:2-C-methyl-D-erythritol 2,4-cyclodiphosphate synthase
MSKKASVKIGIGYDIHRLVPGKRLVLGGVEIPHTKGLLAHSDGDCLYHALADALLGALGLRDIGHYFPNTPEHLGRDSSTIVAFAVNEMKNLGYAVGNVDIVVIAEEPKLSPHVDAIKSNIARLLEIPPQSIAVKATTNEGQDDTRIAVHAALVLCRE